MFWTALNCLYVPLRNYSIRQEPIHVSWSVQMSLLNPRYAGCVVLQWSSLMVLMFNTDSHTYNNECTLLCSVQGSNTAASSEMLCPQTCTNQYKKRGVAETWAQVLTATLSFLQVHEVHRWMVGSLRLFSSEGLWISNVWSLKVFNILLVKNPYFL